MNDEDDDDHDDDDDPISGTQPQLGHLRSDAANPSTQTHTHTLTEKGNPSLSKLQLTPLLFIQSTKPEEL